MRDRRNEIAISIEASRLNHPRDICVHIDVFSEGETERERERAGIGREGKGFFAPSIVTPQLLDGVLIQRLAGSRFAESLVQPTLSFYPALRTPFRFKKEKKPGHGWAST